MRGALESGMRSYLAVWVPGPARLASRLRADVAWRFCGSCGRGLPIRACGGGCRGRDHKRAVPHGAEEQQEATLPLEHVVDMWQRAADGADQGASGGQLAHVGRVDVAP